MSYKRVSVFLLTALLSLAFIACGDDDDNSDVGTGSTDPGTSDTGPEDTGHGDRCIATISGTLLKEDGSPFPTETTVSICFKNRCFSVGTDTTGYFSHRPPVEDLPEGDCNDFDFNTDIPIHYSFVVDGYAQYAAIFEPEPSDISDDFEFNAGEFRIYPVPDEGAQYTKAGGASVNLSGLEFELAADSLYGMPAAEEELVDSATIKVLKAPEEWAPAFNTQTQADIVYFISPYWAKVENGVIFSTQAPDGWNDGDTGSVHLLGEPLSANGYGHVIWDGTTCTADEMAEGEPIEDGVFGECGTFEVLDGKVVTSPMPRLGWIGIKK